MTKYSSRIIAVCAACSLIAASAWAQSESQEQQQNQSSSRQSWSTKHLSATGRDNHQAMRASTLTGAQVKDSSGQQVGTIQDCIINPATGRIDFALLSLNSNGASSTANTSENGMNANSNGKVVPVPWSLLRTSASSQYSTSSQQPTFTLTVSQDKLNSAPTVDLSDLNQSQWQQRIYSYYGVTPNSMGAAGSPQGEIKGIESRHMEETPGQQPQQSNP